MKTSGIFAGGLVLTLLLSSFPAGAEAQECCSNPNAAAQNVEEVEKPFMPQMAAPTPGQGGMMGGMMTRCMNMMRYRKSNLAMAQPAPPQQETPKE